MDDRSTPRRPLGISPGMLLVASPAMTDENFADTVVLVIDVDDEGALGVILNRPSPLLVATVMGEWAHLVAEPEVLFRGGPVGTDGAVALAMLRNGAHTLSDGRNGFSSVLGPVGLIDLETPVEEFADEIVALRLFAGYAGWGPGQLQAEIAAEDWDVVPGQPQDVFGATSERLLRDVLRRQPGELAWRSTRPADPALN